LTLWSGRNHSSPPRWDGGGRGKPPRSWGIHDVAGDSCYRKISINRSIYFIVNGSQFFILRELYLSFIQPRKLSPSLFVH
jgi:hypothetical protein